MTRRLPNPSGQLPNISRRELLASTAAMSAASIAPLVKHTEGSTITAQLDPTLTSESIGPTFSPAMARRLAEITRRNALRSEAHLPLLSTAKEIRQMKQAEAAQDFTKFAERFRGRVQAKVLAGIRRRQGDTDWKPVGTFQGMAIQNEVSERLRRLYERVGLETRPSSSSVRVSASPR